MVYPLHAPASTPMFILKFQPPMLNDEAGVSESLEDGGSSHDKGDGTHMTSSK